MVWISLAVVALIGLWVISSYNSFVARKNRIAKTFSTIDVQLKMRHDLIPQLVSSAKGFMQHERDVLERLAKLRSVASSRDLPLGQKAGIEAAIDQDVRTVIVSVEAYPQLKSDHAFSKLMRSLNEAEEQIAAARRTFNAAVTDYNNLVQMFPTSLIARFFKFQSHLLFEASLSERENVRVLLRDAG